MAALDRHPGEPRVSVVTVSYGSADVLAEFLDSVHAASALSVDAVVVDNKPDAPDGVEDLALQHGVRYLPMSRNLGYGSAMNAAVKALPASIDWILVANPDLTLGAGSIDALVATGDADDTIASVGPAIMTNGMLYPSARAIPSLRNGIGHAIFANVWQGNPWTRSYRHDAEDSPHRRDAGWLSGACVLVRRTAFDELGGFDSGYFMYFEDVDLGYRLGKRGYRNVYEPSAVVTHSGAHSTTAESALMISAHHDSARRFLSRKYSGPLLWPVRAVLTVGLAVRSAVLKRRPGHH